MKPEHEKTLIIVFFGIITIPLSILIGSLFNMPIWLIGLLTYLMGIVIGIIIASEKKIKEKT